MTPHTDLAYDFANMIGEVVKMSSVNPTIVIEQIKEISEIEIADIDE